MGVRISSTRQLAASGLSLSSARYVAAWVRSPTAGSVGDAHKYIATVGPYGSNDFGVFAYAGYNEGTAFVRRTATSAYSQRSSGSSLTSSWVPVVSRITVSGGNVTELAIRQGAGAWTTVAPEGFVELTSGYNALTLGGNQECDVGEVWVYSAFSDTDWAAFRDKTALPETLGTLITGASLLDLSTGLTLSGGGTLVDTGSGTANAVTDTHPITRSLPATLSGNVTLDAVAPAGTLADAGPTSLSGNVTLDAVAPAGTLGLEPGTVTVPALRNWSGSLQTSVTIPVVTVLSMTTGAQVLALTNQTTHGTTANLTITSTSLVVGTTYMVAGWNADGSQRFAAPITAA